MSMTDEQIVKALRLCADRGCYRCTEYGKEYCRETVASLAWDLIYRQQAEIERLKFPYKMQVEVSREIENEIKSEAVREFAERLKEAFPQTDRNNICPALYYDDYCYIIDELAEEMTEKEGGKE